MSSAQDRARRKQLRDAYKATERARRVALLPIDAAQLGSLVESVDAKVVAQGCDHSARSARSWAADNGVAWEPLVAGLAELGGYCDCEIVMNCDVDEVFG